MPILRSSFDTENPAKSFSTTKQLMPRWPASRSVLANTV